MRYRSLISGAIVSMVLLAACNGSSGSSSSTNDDASNASLSRILGSGCDPASTLDHYTNSLGDVSKYDYIYPLGEMTTSHITPVDHIYVYFPGQTTFGTNGSGLPADTYDITSPADGRIVAVDDFQASNQYPYPDHRVVIAHSCNLYSVFIHVGELKGAAAAAAIGGEWHGSIDIRGGEVFADDSQHPGYDFSTLDSTRPATLANPASYAQSEQWKPYVVDPFPYFPTDVREQLDQKSLRASEPFGGRFDWDKPGTAMGNWFVQGSNGYRGRGDQAANYDNHGRVAHGYWDTHLAMAPDAVDNSAFIYSIGDWDGCPCQFMSTTNVDPSTITPSSTPTVLELVDPQYHDSAGAPMDFSRPTKGYTMTPRSNVVGVLAVQLLPDGTLKVQKMPGATSASAFTGFDASALTYER